MPVVRPEAYLPDGKYQAARGRNKTHKARTACTDMNRAGTLKVSKKICAACSRLLDGLRGASVSSTGCYERISTPLVEAIDGRTSSLNVLSSSV